MPPRTDPHAEAVARRLELLSAELAARPTPYEPLDLHTHIRPGREEELEPPPDPPVPRPGRHAARRGSGWLPEPLQGRLTLGPAQVAVLAVVLAVGLAVTAWWVLRAQPRPVEPSAPPAPLATPAAVGSASASPAGDLVVDVAGKVRRPGIVVLDPGSRVVDALRAAGGPRPGVNLSSLNLARLLVDGEQILVGVAAAPGVAASAAASPGASGGALVNLNTATATELEALPGVGPVTAEAIIAFRTEHGAFTAVDQLLDVSGIGEATLAEIAPHVTL